MTVTGVVTALRMTPVKSLRLRAREQLELTELGVRDNRCFFIVDEAGTLVNGKRVASLSAVVADYDPDTERLALEFPDGATVTGEAVAGPAIDARFFSRTTVVQLVGGPFAEALSEYAGQPLRLVRTDPDAGGVDRGTGGSVSLVSEASVAHLGAVAGAAVDPRRFRMLIEVAGPDAHGEDALVGGRARIGEALVAFHGHVGRCLVTGLNPDTGAPDLETLEHLSYRRGLDTTEPLAFGIYGVVIEPGIIRLGDPLVAEHPLA